MIKKRLFSINTSYNLHLFQQKLDLIRVPIHFQINSKHDRDSTLHFSLTKKNNETNSTINHYTIKISKKAMLSNAAYHFPQQLHRLRDPFNERIPLPDHTYRRYQFQVRKQESTVRMKQGDRSPWNTRTR
jgi:hypothetical protein